MGKLYDGIDDTLARFIAAQHVFFVATAPLDPAGHVNLSPKGLESFRVIDPKTVAYLDLTGSGIETLFSSAGERKDRNRLLRLRGLTQDTAALWPRRSGRA